MRIKLPWKYRDRNRATAKGARVRQPPVWIAYTLRYLTEMSKLVIFTLAA